MTPLAPALQPCFGQSSSGLPSTRRRTTLLAAGLLRSSCAGLLACAALPAAAVDTCPAPAALHQLRAQLRDAPRYQLDNGARLTVLPDARARSAALSVAIRAGARNERAGEHGYAHLLEHLLFTGSEQLPPGGYENVLRARGGAGNASTSYDLTQYYAAGSAGNLGALLWLQADALLRPALADAALTAQKQAVAEETRLRIEQPPYVGPAMRAALDQFAGTGWGHSILGDAATLAAATPDSLRGFWQAHYGARRQHWVVAGKVDADAIAALWRRELAGHPTGSEDSAAEPFPRRHFRLQVSDPRAPWPVRVWGWYLPPASTPDGLAAQLAFQRLHHELALDLREQRQVLFRTHQTLSLAGGDVGFLVLAPRAAVSLDALDQTVRAALQRSARTPPDERAVCAAMQRRWQALLNELETPLAQAHWLAGALANDLAPLDLLSLQPPAPAALAAAQQALAEAPEVGLSLQPAWYWRAVKTLFEILPTRWSQAIEERAL